MVTSCYSAHDTMTNYDYNLLDELCCERYEEIGDKLLYEVSKITVKNAARGLRPRTAVSTPRSKFFY